VINAYYVEKVQKIRAGRGVQNSTGESAAKPRSGDKAEKIDSLLALRTQAGSLNSFLD
jgi:hypothetical protein